MDAAEADQRGRLLTLLNVLRQETPEHPAVRQIESLLGAAEQGQAPTRPPAESGDAAAARADLAATLLDAESSPPPEPPVPQRPRVRNPSPRRAFRNHQGRPAQRAQPRFRPQDCPICLDRIEVVRDAHSSINCEHVYHRSCFAQHLQTRIRDGNVGSLQCPLCPRAVLADEVHDLVSEELWQKYQRFRRDLEIAIDEGRRHCPAPGCSGVISRPRQSCQQTWGWVSYALLTTILLLTTASIGLALALHWGYNLWQFSATCAGCSLLGLVLAQPRKALQHLGHSERGLKATCPECNQDACFLCGQPWHPGVACLEARDSLVEAWATARDAERCPRCGTMIERNAGCNHMTCRRGFGGCGYQFCWLCREEYHPGHFGNGRCPQYGGAPDYDFLRGSPLALAIPPFVLLSGVLAAEFCLMPLAGAAEMLWITALGLAGLVCPNASKHRQPVSRPVATAVGGPLLGTAFVFVWFCVKHSLGYLWAAAWGFLALEATGWFVYPPPTRLSGREGCKPMLWYVATRIFSLIVAVSTVAVPAGLLVLAWTMKSIWEQSCSSFLSCLLLILLRSGTLTVLLGCLWAAIVVGGLALKPGLTDAVSPTSWWMGAAGVARVAALAGLLEVFPAGVADSLFHLVDWALMGAAMLVAFISAGRCLLAVFWFRRSSWPLPWLAASTVWGLRLCLELLGHMEFSVPGLPDVLAFCLSVGAGLLAGTAALRVLSSTCPRLAGLQRRCPRPVMLLRLLAAALPAAAGQQLLSVRTDSHWLFVERLAACGATSTVLAGCVALQLLPDALPFAASSRAPQQANIGVQMRQHLVMA